MFPHGSILGPFLFVLYINDIVNIDHTAKHILYADDTSLFFAGSDVACLSSRANETLRRIHLWATNNELKLNINKTKAVLFHPRNKFCELPRLLLNNFEIEVVESFKTLGVIFSNNLSWDAHINYLSKKLSKVIGLMRRHCATFPLSVNNILYNALFSSTLNYGALVWGTTTKENIKKLLSLQKRAIRLVFKAPYLSHTEDMFKRFKIVNVQCMYNFRLLRQHKLETNKKNYLLKSLARLTKNSPTYHTRYPEKWKVGKCRTTYGKQMLRYTLPNLLNELAKNGTDVEMISFNELRSLYV